MAYEPLYSYSASEPILLGGTHSQFSADDGSTWKNLKGAQELGDIGDVAESVECTTVDDERKMYTGGLKDAAERELAKSQSTIQVKHQWPNGVIATYGLKLLGYQIVSGTADGFMQLKVSGRQTTDVSWSTASTASSGSGGGGGSNSTPA